MNRLKRILILGVVLFFLALYGIALYYAFSSSKNSVEIIVYCFASIGVLSIFIGFYGRYLRYKKDKNQGE
ncbi:MAG: hypothetical protein N4A50_00825 [Vallitalea sp.]|jgi:ammonia channel protein AmtB|nr:hypothetical protein [Vallitalea sp.]